MDHFENIIRLLLEKEGYWVLTSFKVNLTKEEKARTGKPTIPRPEIDLIAYSPRNRELLAVEVKSFFDSTGVYFDELAANNEVATGRYKLFTCRKYREIVFNRLKLDLVEAGYLVNDLPVRLGLAAGNIKNGDEDKIYELMTGNGWFFWPPSIIKEKVVALSRDGYENDATYIVAKILLRN